MEARPGNPASDPLPAPRIMILFGLLLGAVAGTNFAQFLWRFLGWEVGAISIAVPVGGGIGAACGALVGWVTRPATLVLLGAVFAGWAVGATAGRIAWGSIGEMGGQFTGALAGLAVWACWLFAARRKGNRPKAAPPGPTEV